MTRLENENCYLFKEAIDNVISIDDDELVFAEEEDELLLVDEKQSDNLSEDFSQISFIPAFDATSWKVMIVDDEREIHEVTQLALDGFTFQQKPVSFLSAYSAQEAKSLLQVHPDTALVLLDVVMEENDSGLQVVKYIRQTQENHLIRIILRTGQPGEAPEQSVIVNYDINDYKLKVELTQQKLFVTLTTGLRAYGDLLRIELSKTALKHLNELLQKEILERKQKELELSELNTKLIELNHAYERFIPHQFLSLLNKKTILDIHLGDQVEKDMTILFSDIRGFTSLSETLSVRDNFEFLNIYLGQMGPIIAEHGGFVDKYIGDAIMALFHGQADDAVRCGIAMLKKLARYNQLLHTAGFEMLKIGIGINTGHLMLGILGSQNHMESTVIADAVNVSARLESLTKEYEVPLLITGQTYQQLEQPGQYHIRVIDWVKVKGKSEPTTVYEVFDADPPGLVHLKKETSMDFESACFLYHAKDFDGARNLFQKVLQVNAQDEVAKIYLKRCKLR